MVEQKYRIGNEHGHIMWDISLMLQDKKSFSLRSFAVEKLISENPFHGDAAYAMHTDIHEPLIVVQLDYGLDKLIDGNHRLYKMRKMGLTHLQAYYLSFKEHSRYIVDFDEKVYWDIVKHWINSSTN